MVKTQANRINTGLIFLLLIASLYFIFAFTQAGTVSPNQIQLDHPPLGGEKESMETQITGWPAGWQYTGTVTCFCENYGDNFTNRDNGALLATVSFWGSINVLAFLPLFRNKIVKNK